MTRARALIAAATAVAAAISVAAARHAIKRTCRHRDDLELRLLELCAEWGDQVYRIKYPPNPDAVDDLSRGFASGLELAAEQTRAALDGDWTTDTDQS